MPSDDLIPIAIVGMACRLPGDVSTPDDFWRLMSKGRSCWSKIPKDRFNPEAYNHPNPEKKGATINAQGGYFLSQDIQMFDPAFFDMTKKEAETMDPVQRLLLECTYEALENAGIPKEKISGRNVGVFIGGSQNEHRHGNLRDLDDAPMYDPTGSQGAFLAGRISYFYNLRGPAFTLDTACSSSMYAMHQAVQSIRSGESEQAIVGASHLITQPDIWVAMAKLRLFAESGKTYAFDHRAKSGYARGEGAGVIILKPLHKAIEDGDHVRAVIKHTGLSHNGRTVGIVAPSEDEQERLVRNVLSQANIDPKSVAFFEAHGTGTAKGDPIEATAIHRVFDKSLSRNDPLHIGSVKANIGHLENASGIVSVIKAALMLEKGFIVPNADFERPNPAIPLAEWNMKIAQRQIPLPRNKDYVCVNNFGFSGSNGHAVLEPIPSSNEKFTFGTTNGNDHLNSKRLFVLSANDEEALRRSVEKLGVFIEQHAELYQTTMSQNLAYTLCQRRSHLSWRLAVVSDMCSSLAVALNSPDAVLSRAPAQPPKVAFVFTGQGAQWHAMGRELLKSHPVFESAINRADKYLLTMGSDFSLLEELLRSKEDTQVNKAHISQPICSAVQIALVDLLASWGIKPSAVTGHSSGEIGAAYAAGALTWEGAMSAAYHRGQAIVELKRRHPELKGAMMAVGMSAEDLKPMFKTLRHPLQAVAACENSPESTTVSGDEEAIDAVSAMVTEKGLFNRKLQVDVAYHSPHMRLIADSYYDTISSIGLCETDRSVEFFSSVRAQKIGTDELGPQYWVDNLTNPVRFSSAVQKLCQESSPDVIVEIGPAAALKGPMLQTLKSLGLPASKMPGYMSALARNRDATVTCMELAGQLWTRGYEGLDWFNINHNRAEMEKPDVISYLYAYPWSRQRCWYESRITRQHRLKAFARHDLLGTLADWSSDLQPTWRNFIRLDEIPWLRDSLFHMRIVFPVSAFISMIIEAANQRAIMQSVEAGTFELRDVVIKEHLYLHEGEQVEMLVNFQPSGATGDEFRITTYEAKRGWLEHIRGVVEVKPAEAGDGRRHSSVMRQANMNRQPWQKQIPAATHYVNMIAQGAGCPGFMWNLKKMGIDGDTYSANGALLETTALMPMEYEKPYLVHPAVLEPLLQVSQLECGIDGIGAPQLTSSIQQMRINLNSDWRRSVGEKFFVQSTKDRKTGTFLAELFAPIESKTSVVSILGLKLAPLKAAAEEQTKPRELCYKTQWVKTEERKANGICQAHLDLHGSCVVLVTDRAQSDPLVAALSQIIQENVGITPRVSKLGEIQDFSGLFIMLNELDKPLLLSIGKEDFERVQKIMVRSGGLMWVTRGASKVATNPNANVALGLVRNARSELVKLASILDLDPNSKLDVSAQAELIEDAFRRSVLANNPEAEAEFAEEDGDLVVPRILVDEETNLNIQREFGSSGPYLQAFKQPGRQLRLAAEVDESLESLYFEDCPSMSRPLGENEVEVEVMASRLGPDDAPPKAAEAGASKERSCSGVVTRVGAGVSTISVDDRVCLLAEGAFGSHARAPATSVFRLPQALSYGDAALVPSAFGTAFYALAEVSRVRKGERVLIQVNGDVGMAAIEVARHLGADVFVVSQGPEERETIINSCTVDPERILDVRSVYFDREVQTATEGHGMDVVFTSQGGNGGSSINDTKVWSCVAPFGRVVAVQGSNNRQEAKGISPPMAENVSFTTINMLSLAATRPQVMATVLAAVVESLTQGHFEPLQNLQTLSVTELSKGLQMVQRGSLGPVVVTPKGDQQVMATHATAGSALNRDGTHVIVGGTGGLGRSMAKWMVKNGARHIVLLSRSGGSNVKVKKLIQKLSGQATVVAKACDVADEQQVRLLISDCAKTLPPICGVVHAAMVLEDGLFEDMTHAAWASTVRSKTDGTWNIHNALEAANTRLDYFVLFSSASGVLGSRGQAAYAAANTFLDGFAAYRRANGLPGVSLDLTAITGAGYIAENKEREEEILKNFGGETASIEEVLGLLAVAISGRCPQAQVLTGLKLAPHPQTGALPYYASDPRFAELKAAAVAAAAAAGGSGARVVSYRDAFRAAAKASPSDGGGAAAMVEVATEGILEKLSEVLSVARADVDAQRSMASYGLDSLTAIEVRNWITRELGANLQILELLTTANVTVLAELIVSKAEGAGAVVKA